MARHRFKKKRSFFGRAAKSVHRRYRSTSGTKLIHLDAMAYGAIRNFAANLVTPYLNSASPNTAMYNDNIAMAIISYGAARFGSGMIRDIGQKGLIVENALVAADLASNILPTGQKSTSNEYVYG
jgi:hypothetical protein